MKNAMDLIETGELTGLIETVDTMVKAANVRLINKLFKQKQ